MSVVLCFLKSKLRIILKNQVVCMAVIGTGTLAFINDFTTHGNNGMNADVYRKILCPDSFNVKKNNWVTFHHTAGQWINIGIQCHIYPSCGRVLNNKSGIKAQGDTSRSIWTSQAAVLPEHQGHSLKFWSYSRTNVNTGNLHIDSGHAHAYVHMSMNTQLYSTHQ